MEEDSINCSYHQFTEEQKIELLYIYGGLGAVSTLVCTVALVVALLYRFYKNIVQRVVLYQLIAAVAVSLICALDIIFVNYEKNVEVYRPICRMAAYFNTVSLWSKIGFTFWLTLLLFLCLACGKSPKELDRLEKLFILTSIGLPLLFCWIPFANDLYGIAGAWCWINNWKDECAKEKIVLGTIEQYLLFYAPATLFLLIDLLLLVITVIVQIKRIMWFQQGKAEIHRYDENITDEKTFLIKEPSRDPAKEQKQGLKMVLPLLFYPIVSIVLYVFPFTNRVYGSISDDTKFPLFVLHGITEPLWGSCVGIIVAIHICIMKCSKKPKNKSQVPVTGTGSDRYNYPKDSDPPFEVLMNQ